MVLKVIRSNRCKSEKEGSTAGTLVYEPAKFEMYPIGDPDNPDASDQLLVCLKDGTKENLLMFPGDEVWLTGEDGKTVDRWSF